ncbi:DMT family transporter [Sinorhizobium terangae]|uniref:Guanidinium exporter n=1 Tax=Sinorhizobium terangae TaxID=110322 RepID=A0A6N7LC70_SINTE|nr:multidrug efflux SMR transporter [Sinorhizobium terangae]MBB4183764.1 quaternary ammonium compound-resistance protein SugE [Sinorhizobium terangae]MQX15206.1 QacE family quaternary ammonium compound efflux SMR transporter [Sinorhizobium terangae]WFU47908.1 multidrug efflux SMR transporter [Sinorhizobium terangae]
MAWITLLAASAVEIAMGLALKYAEGWTRLVPSIIGVVAALASVYLLTIAMRELPAGTAYAAWTGIGSVGITVLGIVLFGDPVSWLRLVCIAMIIVAVAGLRFLEA